MYLKFQCIQIHRLTYNKSGSKFSLFHTPSFTFSAFILLRRASFCVVSFQCLWFIGIQFSVLYRHVNCLGVWRCFMSSCHVSGNINPLNPQVTNVIYIYGAPILDVSRSHTTTQHSRQDSSGRVISSSQGPLLDNTRHSQQTNIHAPGAAASLCVIQKHQEWVLHIYMTLVA